jgi:glycosyltransferase involved in cell wall biosynthesis
MGTQAARPKLLALLPRYPFPVIGGDRLRIHELCRALSNDFDITLVAMHEERQVAEPSEEDRQVYATIHTVRHARWRSWLGSALAFFNREPIQIGYYRSTAFRRTVKSLAPSHDIVLCHLIRTMRYGMECQKPLIVEMTDAVSLTNARVKFRLLRPDLRSLARLLEFKALNAMEKTAPGKADWLIFVSRVDVEFLYGRFPPSNILVCGNGVDLRRFPLLPRSSGSWQMCFIGKITSLPNQDAVSFFVESVLPILSKKGPFILKVVGVCAKRFRSKFADNPSIIFTGEVASIAESVSDCFCGVAPMRIGGGVKNKVLEYMALGLPTVTTAIGAEGFEISTGMEVLIADDPQDIADGICRIHADGKLANSLRDSARKRIETTYSWPEQLHPAREIAKKIIQ